MFANCIFSLRSAPVPTHIKKGLCQNILTRIYNNIGSLFALSWSSIDISDSLSLLSPWYKLLTQVINVLGVTIKCVQIDNILKTGKLLNVQVG